MTKKEYREQVHEELEESIQAFKDATKELIQNGMTVEELRNMLETVTMKAMKKSASGT
jgi:hypothetical protein